MKKLFSLLLILLGLMAPYVAKAVPCSNLGVTINGGCADGTGENDSTDALNNGSFFSFSDWKMLDKTDNGVDASLWTGDFTGTEGFFTLANDLWSKYKNLVVVLKDGGAYDPKNPDIPKQDWVKWSAYLLVPGTFYYEWIYGQIVNENVTELKDVSHISLYGQGEPSEVPEPATMLLLGTGLAGLAGATRKRYRK